MIKRYYFRVNGMHSDVCLSRITNALQLLPDIEVLEIDLETGMVVINSKIEAAAIGSIIDAEGYNAILIPE